MIGKVKANEVCVDKYKCFTSVFHCNVDYNCKRSDSKESGLAIESLNASGAICDASVVSVWHNSVSNVVSIAMEEEDKEFVGDR